MLAADADGGVVVARRDGLTPDELRALAIAKRDALTAAGGGVVGLVGLGPDGTKAGIVVALSKDLAATGTSAAAIATGAARALGGGTGKQADLAVGGGPNVAAVDEALALLEDAARDARTVRE
jgi:alanyl-tRNA synthetase